MAAPDVDSAEEYRRLLASEGFEVIRVSPLASFDLVAMEAIWSPGQTKLRKPGGGDGDGGEAIRLTGQS